MSDKQKVNMWRTAGEMYGRLRELLPIGYLTMEIIEMGVSFRWDFKVRNQRFGSQHTFSFVEIVQNTDMIHQLTERVGRKWNDSSRRVFEEEGK